MNINTTHLQMEMDDDIEVPLTRLEDSNTDVLVHDIHVLIFLGHETETIGVSLQAPHRLAAAQMGPHGQLTKAGWLACLEPVVEGIIRSPQTSDMHSYP